MQSSNKKKTFEGDASLPSLPLPDLKHTLDRYLDSLKPFTTPEEYQKSAKIVEAFQNGIGAKLHEKLKKKAKSEKNWVEKWWEEYGYLRNREPLLPYCSMVGFGPKIPGCAYGHEEDQIKNASLICYYTVEFYVLLRKQELKPTETSGGKIFSMSQFRRLFGTVRRPGYSMDSLEDYFRTVDEGPCPTNVIVLCKGRIFSMNCVDENGNPITPPEWEEKIRWIKERCEDGTEGQNVGTLTCDNRTKWCKYRQHLLEISGKNKDVLDEIEKSLFVLVLDDETPESMDTVPNYNLTGDYNNRWADKSMALVVYKNGFFGSICDHTAYDGIASITCLHYSFRAISDKKGVWVGTKPDRVLPPPKELTFDLDQKVNNKIRKMNQDMSRKTSAIYRFKFEDYGKLEIQRMKIHPDSYVQMALQLAYYRLHKKPAPCYETATTRTFFNGRTETVRSCTVECIDWVKAMLDNKTTEAEKSDLLVRAIKRHDQLMAEARANAGCDRHLFGLYCTALEEGIPVPELYTDPSYFKSGGGGNFVLSTSCSGFTPMSGGVTAMCIDGYGVFYNIMPDTISVVISINTKSRETSHLALFESIKISLTEMRSVMLYRKKAKL